MNRTSQIKAIIDKLNDAFSQELRDAQRVFHGRGQLYPGLEHICIDWYPPIVLITAYQPIADIGALTAGIVASDPLHQIKTVIHQRRYETGAPACCVYGEDQDHALVDEGPLKFDVHPGQQQNAGLFLDMRPLREWIMQCAEGKNVLNLFAYTCSLSVAALAGGAKQVVNVDMSKTSIRWGEANHKVNGQDMRKVRSMPHNIFKSWGRIQQFGRYDLIIIDPPSRQKGSFNAEKNYSAILKKLHKLAKPDASVIATINSPYLGADFVQHQAERYAPKFEFLEPLPVAAEFVDKYPERGLNILHFRARLS